MYGCIYKLTFPDGSYYIGQTTQQLETRLKRHICSATKGTAPINKKIQDVGVFAIKREIIDSAISKADLNKKEIHHITINSGPMCLNVIYNHKPASPILSIECVGRLTPGEDRYEEWCEYWATSS
jgi:predicted GIY-YIG superfamily endonuclease